MVTPKWLFRTKIKMSRVGIVSYSIIVLYSVSMYSNLMRSMLLLFLSVIKNGITELNRIQRWIAYRNVLTLESGAI